MLLVSPTPIWAPVAWNWGMGLQALLAHIFLPHFSQPWRLCCWHHGGAFGALWRVLGTSHLHSSLACRFAPASPLAPLFSSPAGVHFPSRSICPEGTHLLREGELQTAQGQLSSTGSPGPLGAHQLAMPHTESTAFPSCPAFNVGSSMGHLAGQWSWQ